MKEYDSLLKVIYGLATDGEFECLHKIYGTDVIEELKNLITGKRLVIALDQATVKTGMCIIDFDTRAVLAVLDLINSGFPSKQLYFQSLYDFINNHFGEERIELFVYEIPVEHSKNIRTLAVLEAMRGFIQDFKNRIPSLSKINMVEINSNTWRSNFLAAPKYEGRRKKREAAKESAREEAVTRAPSLREYFYATAEPPDSCDAVGIGYGALEEIYSKRTPEIRRPNKTMPRTNVKFKYRVCAVAQEQINEYLAENFPVFYESRAYELLEFNDDLTVEDNCHRYCGTTKKLGIIPIFNRKIMQELKWETGVELTPGQIYIAFCWRSAY